MLRLFSRSICFARVNSEYYNKVNYKYYNKVNDTLCYFCKGKGYIYNKKSGNLDLCHVCNGTGKKIKM